MVAELLALTLLRAQVAAMAAVLLVLLLRGPARSWIGARLAYRLWILVPAAVLASLFPSLSEALEAGAPAAPMGETHAITVLAAWMVGALVAAGIIVQQEVAFRRQAGIGQAGPAVMGVLWPRVVLPCDFAERFDAEARRMVDLHERAHIQRGDPLANLAIAVGLALGWCNPLIHIGAVCARLDQELACDAQVLSLRPTLRKVYAEALVKAHAARTGSPLACFWAAHPLLLRVKLLAQPEPSEERHATGAVSIVGLAILTALVVWSVTPRGPMPPHFIWPGEVIEHQVDGINLPALRR